MHQPYYQDPFTRRFELPWVRLHGMKDYFGMVRILEDFPRIKATYNLVPSLLSQLEDYVAGDKDRFQELFDKPAVELDQEDVRFLARHFFSANEEHLIRPYPRYNYLLQKRKGHMAGNPDWRRVFGVDELRDIQCWFKLCYFDEYYKLEDEEIVNLIVKGHHFSESDKAVIRRKELELLGRVIPEYKAFADSGQIEISTTPFYHPILPLLIDPQLGRVTNPSIPEYELSFNWLDDAVRHLDDAMEYMERLFGKRPRGIWPSEGSLSLEVLDILDRMKVRWTATDEMNLEKSAGVSIRRDRQFTVKNPELLYKPYRLSGQDVRIFFRDHYLSDLIGFYYQKFPPIEAAEDFVRKLKAIPADGNGQRVVPVILDGENAWEYYPGSGREFLRHFFHLVSNDPELETVTFSEAADLEAGVLNQYAPGSWINGNFDIWIGDEEDRRAWRLLEKAKAAVEESKDRLTAEELEEVTRLLFVAQGSDWFWWYGSQNYTPDLDIFDRLFRLNLQKIFDILQQPAPVEFFKPVAELVRAEDIVVTQPTNYIQPRIDGNLTHYFDWFGAGKIEMAFGGGAMNVAQKIVRRMYYGFDSRHFFLRIDTVKPASEYFDGGLTLAVCFQSGGVEHRIAIPGDGQDVKAGVGQVIEMRIPFQTAGIRDGAIFKLFLELNVGDGMTRVIPPHDFVPLLVPGKSEYAGSWLV
jgi:alpha-amylase/alpha-mannosidase (GH57 family)